MTPTPFRLRAGAVLAALALLVCGCTTAADLTPSAHSTGENSDAHPQGHVVAPAGADAASQASPPAATPLPRTGWTATASDEETTGENGGATNVLDGDASTFWRSRMSGTPTQPPHRITIDMKTSWTVAGLRYLPIQGSADGRIGRFEIRVSADGTEWSAPLATGTWADTADEKTVEFQPVAARFVRLIGLTEAGGRGPWSAAAELNLLARSAGPNAPPPSAPVLERTGWVATASAEKAATENGRASDVLDGSTSTYWHSGVSGAGAGMPHSLTIDLRTSHELAGLKYLPRAGTVRGGTIGAFTIAVSADGTEWGSPVASGTWPDTAEEKLVDFPPVQARYLRLTALTEAGGRGPWSSAAEVNLLGRMVSTTAAATSVATSAGTAAATSASLGSWGPTINFPLVPGAAALLPGNKLLTWSAYSPTAHGGSNGRTQTAILNLATGVVSRTVVSNTNHDMFCPGTAMLRDGRLLVSGGSNSGATSIYNPSTNAWSAGPAMKIKRAYQSNVTLSNGEVFALGGSWAGGAGGKNGEVWSASGGWRKLPGATVTPILTADPRGVYRADNHAWLFAQSRGVVFHAGPSRRMNTYTTTAAGSVKSAGTRADSADAMNGNAVMYSVNKILTVGGAPAYDQSDATARAYTIDLNDGVRTTRVGDMAFRRTFASAVVLPGGTVLVTGGQSRSRPFSDEGAAMQPELWNPSTGKFTTLAPMAVPRTYHSFALLLPDARVFVGGGGLCGTCATNHPNGQIFTPPYLLNGDGTAKPRPSILKAPSTAQHGQAIAVTTSVPIRKFSLVRFGSATHTVNTDQRQIPLTAVSTSGNTATLQLRRDTGVLVPGRYLLFALDANGVPSVAKTIRIG